MYKNIDFNKLFDNESEFAKKYKQEKLTDNRIKEVEEFLGYKLPKSYIELLKVQNGGYINKKHEICWLTAIYGIGANDKSFYGLEEEFKLWIDEWGYPDIGIPFGETQSGGHDMYFMDYSSVDERGEPRIVRIDNEDNNARYLVANNFEEFINKVYNNEDIHGEFLDKPLKTNITDNVQSKEQVKNGDDLKINSIIVLCIAIFFLIFAIPLGIVATIIDCSIILICIVLIVYSKCKNKK
ncbi:MAG: SMI1/KNR4 family protein [Clostridia bacterium]|nr:SMI1/KNR4 family protein [Clostridia bacterium]